MQEKCGYYRWYQYLEHLRLDAASLKGVNPCAARIA